MLITIGIVVSLVINIICLIYIFSYNKRIKRLEKDTIRKIEDLKWEVDRYIFIIGDNLRGSLDSVNESNKNISEILNKL